MALERYRLKKPSELKFIFDELHNKEQIFIAGGLDFNRLLISEPSVIPLFSCHRCLKNPALTRETSISKKTQNAEHKTFRWRYVCPDCASTPANHSKSIFLAKLDWNFENHTIWSSDQITVFDLKNRSLNERKAHLHYIREVLECRVQKMEVEYFIHYAKGPEKKRMLFLDEIERYKLFLHWQIIAQRIVAHEIKQAAL